MDSRTIGLIGSVMVVLALASGIVQILRKKNDFGIEPSVVQTFSSRVRAWWILFACLAGAFLFGHIATVILFFMISFWALREFITLTPTRLADHRTLFWVFFLCAPLQFLLVGIPPVLFRGWLGVGNYAIFSIAIPCYAFLVIPARIAVSGDPKDFLERSAKIMVGLLICVYCLSFAPALLTLDIPAPRASIQEVFAQIQDMINVSPDAPISSLSPEKYDELADTPAKLTPHQRLRLLFFLVLIVQLSDAFQYLWSQLLKGRLVAPDISFSRTWQGVLCGTITVALIGGLLWWATPFPYWWQSVAISAIVSILGFCGNLTMSAIKRDRGVSDYGTLITGHSGVLDRVDSLCFAAPVFYHLTYFFMA